MSYFSFAISVILLAATLQLTATQLEQSPGVFTQIIGRSNSVYYMMWMLFLIWDNQIKFNQYLFKHVCNVVQFLSQLVNCILFLLLTYKIFQELLK